MPVSVLGAVSLRNEHPAPPPHRTDAVGAHAAPDPDDERVGATCAEIGDARMAGEFGATEYAAGVAFEDVVHGPLLGCQMLEGVRILHRT